MILKHSLLLLALFACQVLGIFQLQYPDLRAEAPDLDNQVYSNLLASGAHNVELFKQLSKEDIPPALALAYLRQAKLLSPLDEEVTSHLETIRRNIQLETDTQFESPWYVYLVPQHWISERILDLILVPSWCLFIILLSLSVAMRFQGTKSWIILCFLILSYITIVRTAFVYNRLGQLQLISNFDDLWKAECVILSPTNVFSSKDQSSQLVEILPPGSEVNIANKSEITENWIPLTTKTGRSGWAENDEKNIWILKR